MNVPLSSFLGRAFLVRRLLPAFATAFGVWLAGRAVRLAMRRIAGRLPGLDRSAERLLVELAVWTFYVVGLVAALSFLGVNTAGLVAALSAVGLAVALSLKDTLGNVAAGLQLLLLCPIRTGDYVQCGAIAGTVEEIGLFATRLRTFDGLFVSAPNSLLCGAPLTNYTRNPTRRLDIPVAISYGDSLDTGLRVLLDIASRETRLLPDPAPRAFVAALGDNGVELTLRAWVPRADFFDVKFDLSRALKLAIEDAGLTIPFPQRDVRVTQCVANAPAKR